MNYKRHWLGSILHAFSFRLSFFGLKTLQSNWRSAKNFIGLRWPIICLSNYTKRTRITIISWRAINSSHRTHLWKDFWWIWHGEMFFISSCYQLNVKWNQTANEKQYSKSWNINICILLREINSSPAPSYDYYQNNKLCD